MSMNFVQQPQRGKAINQMSIQKLLDENVQLIQSITEYQNKGRANECMQFQVILHRNLVYLATVADTNFNIQTLLPPPNQLQQQQQQQHPVGTNGPGGPQHPVNPDQTANPNYLPPTSGISTSYMNAPTSQQQQQHSAPPGYKGSPPEDNVPVQPNTVVSSSNPVSAPPPQPPAPPVQIPMSTPSIYTNTSLPNPVNAPYQAQVAGPMPNTVPNSYGGAMPPNQGYTGQQMGPPTSSQYPPTNTPPVSHQPTSIPSQMPGMMSPFHSQANSIYANHPAYTGPGQPNFNTPPQTFNHLMPGQPDYAGHPQQQFSQGPPQPPQQPGYSNYPNSQMRFSHPQQQQQQQFRGVMSAPSQQGQQRPGYGYDQSQFGYGQGPNPPA